MKSIRRTLLLWLSIGLALGIAAAAGITYNQARDEANALFDYQMKQIAASLPREAALPMESSRGEDIDLDQDILIQIWDRSGVRIYHSHERPNLPRRITLGFSDVKTNDGVWRVYSALYGDAVVQVAQPTSARAALAARTALKTAAPLLALWPLLALLAWIAIGRGLAPVMRVAHEVGERDSRALTPVSDAGMPDEIRPLTRALNDLLARLGRAIETQRDFVADAAHELRTPLTALTLQLQLLERAGNDSERAAAAADLRRGLERASHLVSQLLTLSRQESDEARPMQAVDLAALARIVVADQAPIAAHRNIDLGLVDDMQAGTPATLNGDFEALRVMLGNLVENAIRYTQAGGRVDVALAADGDDLLLTVSDTGPGIPEEDRARVFDRFYRRESDDGGVTDAGSAGSAGSGLGLAIVKKVVERHHGEIKLSSGRDGRGLTVAIKFRRG